LILDNPSPHADYVKLENFGPLRSLIKYGTIDEAIEIANSTDYGLGGSVWGRDPAELDAVAHRMEAGTVWINQHLVVKAAGDGDIRKLMAMVSEIHAKQSRDEPNGG